MKQKRTSRVLASGSFEVFAEAVAEPLAAAPSVAEVPAASDEQQHERDAHQSETRYQKVVRPRG